MSTRVDKLLQALEEIEVFFFEYTRIRSKEKVIFIIEGVDDPKFYTSKISSILGDKWDMISVGGKSKTLEVRKAIRNNPAYKNDHVYFFIDKDFDEINTENDIYTTPCYSIENLYCEPTTIKNLIISECGLSNYKTPKRLEIIEFIISEYIRIRSTFHKSKQAIAANSIFLYARKRLGTQKISLDKIVKIDVRISQGKAHIKLIKKINYHELKESEKIEFHKFISTDSQLKTILANPGKFFRGKQEILLLKEFIKTLKNDGETSRKVDHLFGHKIKLENHSLSELTLSSVAPYVIAPDCLIKFITNCKEAPATKI